MIKKLALEAIKYSFADYGNLVKGDNMLNDDLAEKINKIFDRIKPDNEQKPNGRKKW